MANFEYSASDLGKSLVEVLNGGAKKMLTMEDFGITHEHYHAALCLCSSSEVTASDVAEVGLNSVGVFHDILCRCHLWNTYAWNTQHPDLPETVLDFFQYYETKIKLFHPMAMVHRHLDQGNVLDFLRAMDTTWLVTVGW